MARQGTKGMLYYSDDGDQEFFDGCDKLEEMIDSGDMDWCLDTLESIREWAEEKEMITEAQYDSINNFWDKYQEKQN